jgi:hypothetical protein
MDYLLYLKEEHLDNFLNTVDLEKKDEDGRTFFFKLCNDALIEGKRYNFLIKKCLEKSPDLIHKNQSLFDKIIYLWINNDDFLEFLFEKYDNYNHKFADNGNNLLHHICNNKKDITRIASLLLKKGVDINEKNKNGDPPLHLLYRYHENDTFIKNIEFLTKNGADINSQNNYGDTSLHRCVKIHLQSDTTVILRINFLLKLGADITIKNNDNLTAFDIIKRNTSLYNLFSKPQETEIIELKKEITHLKEENKSITAKLDLIKNHLN